MHYGKLEKKKSEQTLFHLLPAGFLSVFLFLSEVFHCYHCALSVFPVSV